MFLFKAFGHFHSANCVIEIFSVIPMVSIQFVPILPDARHCVDEKPFVLHCVECGIGCGRSVREVSTILDNKSNMFNYLVDILISPIFTSCPSQIFHHSG